MTSTEKRIIRELLKGGNIAHNGISGIRLRDRKFNPVQKVTPRRFYLLKDLLKKNKTGLWVLSPRAILKLRANSWVKKQYKLTKQKVVK